jgi:hypothetical protein
MDNEEVKVVRPVKGIERSQFQPIIRNNANLQIALSPLNVSPSNYESPKIAEGKKDKKKENSKQINFTKHLN